jgi:RNA 2',3'-cyclic 3'-phosphodiesterase
VSRTASVEGNARVRLFLALQLPETVVDDLVAWQRRLPPGDFRLVPRENLHLTLAFLGHRPADELEPIRAELDQAAEASERIVLRARRYRETRSVGMLVLDDEGGAAGRLAADLHGRLARLGVYESEERAWLPHLTVVRFRRRPRLAPEPPQLGPISPSEAAVYHSVLRPGGAQYVVLHSGALSRTTDVGG